MRCDIAARSISCVDLIRQRFRAATNRLGGSGETYSGVCPEEQAFSLERPRIAAHPDIFSGRPLRPSGTPAVLQLHHKPDRGAARKEKPRLSEAFNEEY